MTPRKICGLVLLALCLHTTALANSFVEQKVLVVQCKDGQAKINELVTMLLAGWRVIAATPVTDSDSVQIVGKPKQSYTASIVYVIQKG